MTTFRSRKLSVHEQATDEVSQRRMAGVKDNIPAAVACEQVDGRWSERYRVPGVSTVPTAAPRPCH